GISQLRFKPAYNPYTEPSMEVFSYHEGEEGSGGALLRAGGGPRVVPRSGGSALGFSCGVGGPTMIKYGINNIRELVGHRVNLQMVYDSPLCRLDV
ncbi:SYFA ligase, partial [Peucedramus taeniatus]|nr:SYFA ligase [Peucedramus taeniatus]